MTTRQAAALCAALALAAPPVRAGEASSQGAGEPVPQGAASPAPEGPAPALELPTAVPVTDRPTPPERPAAAAVVVLRPRVSGAASPTLLTRLADEIRLGILRGRLSVVELPSPPPDRCDLACLTDLREATGAGFVVRATVGINDRDYSIRLELIDTLTGDVVADGAAQCELCGLAEFGTVVADQSALLRVKVEALARRPPTLSVVTDPPGALVFVDGVLIGVSPLERASVAGPHRVRVRLEGHIDHEQEVVFVAGLHQALRVDLQRSPQTARRRSLGWAALATGLPLAAAGVSLLVLDGRQWHGRCEGRDVDLGGHCRYVFTTAWSGGTLLALGAVLTTLGAVVLARTRPRSRLRAVLARLSRQ